MKKPIFILWLSAAALTGCTFGMLYGGKKKVKEGVLGAAAGIAAGAAAAGICQYLMSEAGTPYYSASSVLYEEENVAC